MWSHLMANQACLVHRPPTVLPVGSLAGSRRCGLSSRRRYYRQAAPLAQGHTAGPPTQGGMDGAGKTPAGSQLEKEAPQRAQQQTSSMARGLDPKKVFEQPDLQAVLSLLRSVPPQQLGGSAMGVALLCVDKWRSRQRKRSAVAASPAEEAAAQAIVQLGWQQLASLPGGALVSLLLATLCVTVPTRTLVVAWVSAMQACNGVRELYPRDRAGLLDAAHKLATQSGGELYVPSGMLTDNLLRLVTGDRAARLPLTQLASVWVAIHGLGLWLTSQQQLALASAAVQHLGPDKPVNGVALTQILTTWVDMDSVHIAWRSEQGPNGIPRLDRQQSLPEGEAQTRGSTPSSDHHHQQQQQLRRPDEREQERQLPPPTWQAQGGGTQEPPQRAWQHQLPAEERLGQAQQQHDGYAEARLAVGAQSYSESLELDEMEDGVASYDNTTYRPPSGYPGHQVMCAVVLHCHAHRDQLGPWALGQLLGALGALRHAPPPAILADLTDAFRSKLLGPEQARELTSALTGLARLGLDPGEAFCKPCFQVAMADGGADQLLVATVAWALAMFKRCTPGQWAMLLALQGTPPPLSSSVGDSSGEFVAHGHFPTRWLTAYHLLLEQYGSQPSGTEGIAGPGVGAADRPAAGWAPATVEGVGAAELTMAGARAGQSVARLPDELFEQGVLLQQQVLERDRPAQAVVRRTMYHATLTALRQLCAGQYEVREHYLLQDPHSGAAVLLDLAVPELRFGVRVAQSADVVRTTSLPVGHATLQQRLGRLVGWEVALLPPPMLLVKRNASSEELVAAARAFLVKQAPLQQQLPAAALP